jgi:hypothetical protein
MMLKTISTALLAVSVVVAPALAATKGKTAAAPVTKTTTAKATTAKPSALDANAKMHNKHNKPHAHYKKMGPT